MKKNKSFFGGKPLTMVAILTASFALASCDDVYDDDTQWVSDVRNQTLLSPAADGITVQPSADESTTTISWPVVYGAGGYICSVYDVSDAANPTVVNEVEDSLIDGCSITVPREEDVYYKFVIRTAGNTKLNNAEAENPTEVAFNSITVTTATLPDGCDIAEYFEQNPIPEAATDTMLYYNLKAGGNYTLSKDIDFLNKKVTLRTESKQNHATITVADGASFRTYSAMSLKYVDVDMSASSKALVTMSVSEEIENIKGITGTGDYYNDQNAIVLQGCNINGVNCNLIYDDGKKYCLEQLVIKNCVVHLTSSSTTNINGNAIIYFKGGFANTLNISETTFWNNGDSDARYFVQYNNSGRSKRAGYTTNTVIFTNNTFYNVAKAGQLCNYGGFSGQACSAYVLTDCIFVDCGSSQVARRFVGGRVGSGTATFSNNTYMYDGTFESNAEYDTSGTAIEEDPGFANPTSGDFTVSGAGQLSKRTGDPRWLPEETE